MTQITPTSISNASPMLEAKHPIDRNKIFFENLNGWRFISFLLVFFYHSFATNHNEIKNHYLYKFIKYYIFANGDLGVNFFFVLSGFLITYLLLIEQNKYGSIKLGSFYMRRILRIWPLFYFCVFFGFLVFPILKEVVGDTSKETASLSFYLLFINNFDVMMNGFPDSSSLGVLWSVAVEEQFYLVWPILIMIAPRKYLLHVLCMIVVISFAFRLYFSNDYNIVNYHTISAISDMTIGGIFAYLCLSSSSFLSALRNAPAWLLVALYLTIIVLFLYKKEIFGSNAALIALERLVFSLLFGFLIVEQCHSENSFYKMSDFKLISRLGIYTYGMYCLHFIGILISIKGLSIIGWNENIYQVIFLETGIALLISIAISIASYHLFEARFLKLKRYFIHY
jgi:peptidoglycan/LPS O-acetylase OafA/YrhL